MISIEGRTPVVDPGAWIAEGVFLVGSVHLLAGANVWYTAVLRGDIEPIVIGRNTNVQDGVVMHTDPGFPVHVGNGVTIGHRAVVHGCTVEDDVMIGMGAVVMNGAVIGSGSIVAAGAVIPPHLHVPANSLVAGVPGRVRRTTTDEERKSILANADTYLRLASLQRDNKA